MTLLEQRAGDGSLIGRCDARCYNADGPDCDCICGGRNHGAGLSQALENTREMMLDGLPAGMKEFLDRVPPQQLSLSLHAEEGCA
ncbi:MAG: hypothetical protein PHZ19_06020 [Candidatus Thermoplasmatota archaeon]|nr:hypothetical protein [Candidatus Thermoplasmatota archaeon]